MNRLQRSAFKSQLRARLLGRIILFQRDYRLIGRIVSDHEMLDKVELGIKNGMAFVEMFGSIYSREEILERRDIATEVVQELRALAQ